MLRKERFEFFYYFFNFLKKIFGVDFRICGLCFCCRFWNSPVENTPTATIVLQPRGQVDEMETQCPESLALMPFEFSSALSGSYPTHPSGSFCPSHVESVCGELHRVQLGAFLGGCLLRADNCRCQAGLWIQPPWGAVPALPGGPTVSQCHFCVPRFGL